jgi:hypothetical protein
MLGEYNRLGVFEIGLLRKIFGRLGERTLKGEWRNMRDEKLHEFCCFISVTRSSRM